MVPCGTKTYRPNYGYFDLNDGLLMQMARLPSLLRKVSIEPYMGNNWQVFVISHNWLLFVISHNWLLLVDGKL